MSDDVPAVATHIIAFPVGLHIWKQYMAKRSVRRSMVDIIDHARQSARKCIKGCYLQLTEQMQPTPVLFGRTAVLQEMDVLGAFFESIKTLDFLGRSPQHHIASCLWRGLEKNPLSPAYLARQGRRSKHQRTDPPCSAPGPRAVLVSTFCASFRERYIAHSERSGRISCHSSAIFAPTSVSSSSVKVRSARNGALWLRSLIAGKRTNVCHWDSMKHPLTGWHRDKNSSASAECCVSLAKPPRDEWETFFWCCKEFVNAVGYTSSSPHNSDTKEYGKTTIT